jgi:hypothetical protein
MKTRQERAALIQIISDRWASLFRHAKNEFVTRIRFGHQTTIFSSTDLEAQIVPNVWASLFSA